MYAQTKEAHPNCNRTIHWRRSAKPWWLERKGCWWNLKRLSSWTVEVKCAYIMVESCAWPLQGERWLISQEGKFSCLLVRWSAIDSTIFYHASLLKMQLAGGEGKDPKIHQLTRWCFTSMSSRLKVMNMLWYKQPSESVRRLHFMLATRQHTWHCENVQVYHQNELVCKADNRSLYQLWTPKCCKTLTRHLIPQLLLNHVSNYFNHI